MEPTSLPGPCRTLPTRASAPTMPIAALPPLAPAGKVPSWPIPSAARPSSASATSDYTIYRLDAVAKDAPRRGPAAVLAQDPAGKPAPHRGRPGRPRRGHRGAGQLGPEGRARQGDRLHAGPRAAAGLHRRARPSSIWPPCATPCSSMGGDPTKINPLLPAELVIDHSVQVDDFGSGLRLPHQRRPGVRSATASATPSCAGARRRSATSRSCRRTPASSTR